MVPSNQNLMKHIVLLFSDQSFKNCLNNFDNIEAIKEQNSNLKNLEEDNNDKNKDSEKNKENDKSNLLNGSD